MSDRSTIDLAEWLPEREFDSLSDLESVLSVRTLYEAQPEEHAQNRVIRVVASLDTSVLYLESGVLLLAIALPGVREPSFERLDAQGAAARIREASPIEIATVVWHKVAPSERGVVPGRTAPVRRSGTWFRQSSLQRLIGASVVDVTATGMSFDIVLDNPSGVMSFASVKDCASGRPLLFYEWIEWRGKPPSSTDPASWSVQG